MQVSTIALFLIQKQPIAACLVRDVYKRQRDRLTGILLVAMMFVGMNVSAQRIRVQGHITNPQGKSVPNVNCLLYTSNLGIVFQQVRIDFGCALFQLVGASVL